MTKHHNWAVENWPPRPPTRLDLTPVRLCEAPFYPQGVKFLSTARIIWVIFCLMLDRNSQLVDDTRGTNPFPHSRPSLTWTSTSFFYSLSCWFWYCLVYPLTHFSLHFTTCFLIPLWLPITLIHVDISSELRCISRSRLLLWYLGNKRCLSRAPQVSSLTGESPRLVVFANTISGVLNCTDGLFSSQGGAWPACFSAYDLLCPPRHCILVCGREC